MNPPEGLFRDVTRLFEEASQELENDELLMVDGFTLYEAMSVVEIGDPRMDSGAPLPSGSENRTEFDPLTPLLPEEVCWILDRSLACEMHWHTGNALAQTVYTCLYMHHLLTIDQDCIPLDVKRRFDDGGLPVQLVSLVVRAGVMGMVKCCDLAYRELVKSNVHDCEDWQGEKSDTSLLESVSPQRVMIILEEAEMWLTREETQDVPFWTEMLYRIRLRGTLLRLFSLEMPQKMPFVVPLLAEARHLLSIVKQHLIPVPSEGSPAHIAFDSRVTRRLHSVMPMQPLTLPPQSEAWRAAEGLLDGWELAYRLSGCESLLSWNTVGILRISNMRWLPSRPPFIRSLIQTIFSDGSTILERFAVSWLVEHFFLEQAHISFSHLVSLFDQTSTGMPLYSFEEFHGTLTRLLVQHIWALYHNRPRHRRHSMKMAVEWHELYHRTLGMTARIKPRDTADSRALKCIPLIVLHWRASILRDIVFSGFELELYAPAEYDSERTFAYWYLGKVVLPQDEGILRELLSVVPEGTPAQNHLLVQVEYVALLRDMSLACFTILCRPSNFDLSRRWTNFAVRYKWALQNRYTEITTPDPFFPNYPIYLRQEGLILATNEVERRREAKTLSDSALSRIVKLGMMVQSDVALQLCRTEFTQYHLAGLMVVCESLRQYLSPDPNRGQELGGRTPLGLVKSVWDLDICPWFPKIEESS